MSAVAVLFVGRVFIGVNMVAMEAYKYGFSSMRRDLRREGGTIFLGWVFGFISAACYFTAMAAPGAMVSLIIPVKRTSTLDALLLL